MGIEKFVTNKYLVKEFNLGNIVFSYKMEQELSLQKVIEHNPNVLDIYCNYIRTIHSEPGKELIDRKNVYFIDDEIRKIIGLTSINVIEYLLNKYTKKELENSRVKFYKLEDGGYLGVIENENGKIYFLKIAEYFVNGGIKNFKIENLLNVIRYLGGNIKRFEEMVKNKEIDNDEIISELIEIIKKKTNTSPWV